ncbi:MAG: 4Fe-4S binding protein, partial [Deltaproteobacteria bacterium]|nr:4Fe-4S binding protein [Deltaproteobacteria bacterium]
QDVRKALRADTPRAVDAMTGATITKNAAMRALDDTRLAVATDVLKLEAEGTSPPIPWYMRLLDWKVLYVLFALAGAVVIHLWGSAVWRLGFLVASMVTGGLIFNIQLSSTWLMSLAHGEPPSFAANTPLFLLTVGFVALSVLYGPLYCAHACPFGAIQEVIGRAARRMGLASLPPSSVRAWASGLKFVLLALLVVSLFSAAPASAVGWDPLATVFSGKAAVVPWVIIGISLVGSAVFFRFWCRVFCPVGAFFLLFNRVAGLIGLGPPRRYQSCDLGVAGPADIGCLQCNRCVRDDVISTVRKTGRATGIVYITLVALTAGTVAWAWYDGVSSSSITLGAQGRRMRQVNVEKVLRLFQEDKLSDKEAEYYRRLP